MTKWIIKGLGVLFIFSGIGLIISGDYGPGLLGIILGAVPFFVSDKWFDTKKESAAKNYGKLKEYKTASNQELKMKLGRTPVRKDIDGYYYIAPNYSKDAERYTFENFEFAGSQITQETIGQIKKQGRMGYALAGGALLGSVGAVAGASRKRKDKINTKTTNKEKPGKAKVYLRSIEDQQIKTINFKATQAEAENVIRFFA